MKVLLLGGQGMLGTDWKAQLESRGYLVTAPSRKEFDVTSRLQLDTLLNRQVADYDWVLNAAASTAVDLAESNLAATMLVNAVAPGALAAVCQRRSWRLMHLSTDFVFDGESDRPYIESDPTGPLNVYGRSKRDGEVNVLREAPNSVIVRTSWLFGAHGNCFPRTIMTMAKDGKTLRVVDDQTGCPTATPDLARVLVDLMELAPPAGIYHACGPGAMTWFDLAQLLLQLTQSTFGWPNPINLEPIPTTGYPTPARRPRASVLDTSKLLSLGILPMRPLTESLAQFVRTAT